MEDQPCHPWHMGLAACRAPCPPNLAAGNHRSACATKGSDSTFQTAHSSTAQPPVRTSTAAAVAASTTAAAVSVLGTRLRHRCSCCLLTWRQSRRRCCCRWPGSEGPWQRKANDHAQHCAAQHLPRRVAQHFLQLPRAHWVVLHQVVEHDIQRLRQLGGGRFGRNEMSWIRQGRRMGGEGWPGWRSTAAARIGGTLSGWQLHQPSLIPGAPRPWPRRRRQHSCSMPQPASTTEAALGLQAQAHSTPHQQRPPPHSAPGSACTAPWPACRRAAARPLHHTSR